MRTNTFLTGKTSIRRKFGN